MRFECAAGEIEVFNRARECVTMVVAGPVTERELVAALEAAWFISVARGRPFAGIGLDIRRAALQGLAAISDQPEIALLKRAPLAVLLNECDLQAGLRRAMRSALRGEVVGAFTCEVKARQWLHARLHALRQ